MNTSSTTGGGAVASSTAFDPPYGGSGRPLTWSMLMSALLYFLAFHIWAASGIFLGEFTCCLQLFNSSVCHGPLASRALESEVTACASSWSVVNGLAFHLPLLVMTGHLSKISDQAGRKPIMLLSFAGMIVSAGGYAAVAYLELPQRRAAPIGMPALVVAGMSGSFATFNAATFCFAADVHDPSSSPPLERVFGWLELAIATGGIFGNIASGQLFAIHPVAPFAAAAVLWSLGALVVAIAVRESVAHASPRTLYCTGGLQGGGDGSGGGGSGDGGDGCGLCRTWLDTTSSTLELLRPSAQRHLLGTTTPAWVWCISFMLFLMVQSEVPSLLPLYLALTLRFSPREVGTLLSLTAGARAFSLLVLLPLLTQWAPDRNARALTLLRGAAAVGVLAIALYCLPRPRQGDGGGFVFGVGRYGTYAVALLEGLKALAFPLIRAALSRMVTSQGAVQGLIANMQTLATLCDPFVFGARAHQLCPRAHVRARTRRHAKSEAAPPFMT